MNKKNLIFFIVLFFVLLIFLLLANYVIGKVSQSQKIADLKEISSVIIAKFSPTIIPKKKNDSKPYIAAKSVYLIDAASSYPLYEKNADQRLPIASTTKMMTAIVVLENHQDKIKDVVTITPKMTNVQETTIKLRVGEKITVESLLNGLLIMSGNDAAYALAEYFGGKESFVKEMNQKVSTLGLLNTEYHDPAGLDDNGYSTAKDLAVIAAYGMRNKIFSKIINTPETTIYSCDGAIAHELKNSNRLMRQEEPSFFPYAVGGKTGFTYEAGHVLVSAAEKDGHRIISVVLNTFEYTTLASAKESKKLLEWGFDNWSWQ